MKIATVLLALCSYGYSEGISTKTLNPLMPLTIQISEEETTTLQFPEKVTQIIGLGLVKPSAAKNGRVEYQTAEDGTVVALRALTNAPSRMTVKMGKKWYVITLIVGNKPDMVTTFDAGDLPASNPDQKSQEVDNKTVVKARPVYSTKQMEDLIDLSKASAIIKASTPSQYQGYNFKTCSYKSSDPAITTEVTKVHRWDVQDALVVEATVTNNSGADLVLDRQKMSVAIGREQHPITFIPQATPIPPKQSEYVTAMLVGDYDGSRGRFDLRNEFRLIVNGSQQNYATTDVTPVPAPSPTPSPTPTKGRRP